jgi:hypothetical protein
LKIFYFGFFGVFALTYLAYVTWLTGYKAGYDEGASKAWSTARQALTPHIAEPADLTEATAAATRIVPVTQHSSNRDSL